MKRLIISASLALVFFVPAVAIAKLPTRQHVRDYTRLYYRVQHALGRRAPGREIVKWRLANGRRPTDARVAASIGVLHRMLAPPPLPTPVAVQAPQASPDEGSASSSVPANSPTPVQTSSSTSTSSSGGCGGNTPYSGGGQCWAIPYSIVQCESGGQNVPNSQGSGANGYYQLMVGGGGSKAQQDAAAAALWHGGKGAHNWTCAG